MDLLGLQDKIDATHPKNRNAKMTLCRFRGNYEMVLAFAVAMQPVETPSHRLVLTSIVFDSWVNLKVRCQEEV